MNSSRPPRSGRAPRGAEILGCGLSSFWKLAKHDPKFPKKRALSPRMSVWDEDELIAYRDSKITTQATSDTDLSEPEAVAMAHQIGFPKFLKSLPAIKSWIYADPARAQAMKLLGAA